MSYEGPIAFVGIIRVHGRSWCFEQCWPTLAAAQIAADAEAARLIATDPTLGETEVT